MIGTPQRRGEDHALVTGKAAFVADIALNQPLHLAFVRSPVASGAFALGEMETASSIDGIDTIIVAEDLPRFRPLAVNPMLPFEGEVNYPVLARAVVGAVGQPVAAVLAQTATAAHDAASAITFESLDTPATDPAPGAFQGGWARGDIEGAFARAAHVVHAKVKHPRLAPVSMEPRGIAVDYMEASQSVTVWLSTQTPHRARESFATILDIAPERINVIAPAVGGAFGMKASLYPEEVLAVWAAFRHKRAVRWIASRGDDFLSATHGRGGDNEGALAVAADGTFLGLKATMQTPLGQWLPTSAAVPAWNAGRILPAAYDIPATAVTTRAAQAARAPMGIYRGAGRPEANALMERLVDEAARATGLSPIAIRTRNLLSPEALPHPLPSGAHLDSGRFSEMLTRLCRTAGHDAWLQERDEARNKGLLVGIGMAFYVEPCGQGFESARVSLYPDGTAVVATGGSSQGHGRRTAFAQIAADALNLPLSAITVECGSTRTCPPGIGALASRSTAIGGSAVQRACNAVMEKKTAANQAEPITAEVVYQADAEAWGSGAALIMLRIDAETGVPTITRAASIDDAGVVVNPMMVDGQIRGGFAQGVGEALLEAIVYDEEGQLLTGSLMDYAVPRAIDVPPLHIEAFPNPTPCNLLGAKGVGEAGTISAPAAILNAAYDALSPLGHPQLTLPLGSEQLWRAIRTLQKGQA
ncbi:MAG: xanthine dehydrogenase family protein molybdopterin-binding subunit [Pseudomonadota bacterium]